MTDDDVLTVARCVWCDADLELRPHVGETAHEFAWFIAGTDTLHDCEERTA